MNKSIYENPRHYDLLIPGPNDFAFYRRQIERYGGPALELGCGTGRLTIPLALAGFDITGLDVSSEMLEEANRNSCHRGISLQLIQADCRSYSLGRQFSLIIFPNNSLSHLLTLADIESCFHHVRRHLDSEGRFIVDLFTPSARILSRDPAKYYPVGRYEDPDGRGTVVVTETTQYDAATQVNHIVWHYQFNSKPEVLSVPLNLRMFYPQEIDALLAYNGFAIECKYGNYEEEPFNADSPKQLIVCRAV